MINSNLGIQRFHPILYTYTVLKSLSLSDMEGISGNAITLWQEVHESLKTYAWACCVNLYLKLHRIQSSDMQLQ